MGHRWKNRKRRLPYKVRKRRGLPGPFDHIEGRPLRPLRYQYLAHRHDLYTPVNETVLAWLEELRAKFGSWETMCDVARVSSRWLRHSRHEYKTISMTNLDKILTRCGSDHRVDELEWYDVEKLLELGIWEAQVDVLRYRPLVEKWNEYGWKRQRRQSGG